MPIIGDNHIFFNCVLSMFLFVFIFLFEFILIMYSTVQHRWLQLDKDSIGDWTLRPIPLRPLLQKTLRSLVETLRPLVKRLFGPFQKGSKCPIGAEVVGAEVVGTEVSKIRLYVYKSDK